MRNEAITVFPSACAVVLLGAMTVSDVGGTDGTLTLALGESKQARDRAFLMGADGAEMKTGDLRQGDRVQVEMTADGRMGQLIRVLPAHKAK